MIPLILLGAGAYLIYDSQRPQKMAKGGAIKWQDVEVGDSALVKSENKMGVIVKTYGRKFHLKFVDGTDKTYDAEELKFLKDEEFAKGGAVKRFVEMSNGKPVYALKDAIYHVSYGRLNDKGYPQTTGTSKVYRANTGLKKINDYKKDREYSVFEEKDDEAGIYTITFVDKTGFVVSFDRDDLYEKGGPILENPKFTFKTDNDYHNARSSGYIDDYDIVRIEVKYPTGYHVDFATHSEEEYYEALERLKKSGAEIIRTYQDEMYYDINEYYDADEDKGGDDDDDEYSDGGSVDNARQYVMFVDTLQDAELLGKGGKVKEPRGEIHLSNDGGALIKIYSPKDNERLGYAEIFYDSISDILYSPFKSELKRTEVVKNEEYKSTINKLKQKYSLKPSDKVHYIEQIEIYPEYRGNGYASYLLNGIIEYYKGKGDKYLILTIGADTSDEGALSNSDLKKFYARYGFELIETKGTYRNKMILDLDEVDEFGEGGKIKFIDKVKSISENLKGRKVPKRLQKEYGKTYDKKWERDESARRIAGSQLKKMKE